MQTLLGHPRHWARDLSIATGIGVFLGIIGPFGSFNGGPMELRIFYWVANLWIGFASIAVVARLSVQIGRRLDLPVWFALPAGVAVGVAPLALALDLFSARFWPGVQGRMGPLLTWYGQTLAIAEPCAFGFYFVSQREAASSTRADACAPSASAPAAPAAPPISPTEPQTVFVDRLSGRVGRDLLCLQMEDHYVRAHTRSGSELVLLPLKAAIAEVADLEGLQVHRSWWVSRKAVTEIVMDGRAARLRLVNGVEAPVSRTSVATLRSAGWLDAAEPSTEMG